MTLGSYLRLRREEAGLTAWQVAKSSQSFDKAHRISQSYLSEIENNGKMPSPLKLLTLARLYGITLAEIFQVLGASDELTGVVLNSSSAERLLYPDFESRGIHRQIEDLIRAGLSQPLKKLTDEFQSLIREQRASMLEVIKDNSAEAACVLADRDVLVEYRISPRELGAFRRGEVPSSREWTSFSEGEPGDFVIALHMKNPRLKQPVEATIIVPMVRWWAAYKSVIRRLERRL
ncbi:MAG TPA: helix-turn-helix transcriptional regulator [Acidobacteriota bacterium]|nr:helix-turn-helix transcriptional regulator [Acidobacteriota bacterium]